MNESRPICLIGEWVGEIFQGRGVIRRLEHCREGVVILHGLKVFSNSKRLFNLEVSVTIHSSSF